jgi:hypothetical protein
MERLDKAKMGRAMGPMIFKDDVWRKTGRFEPWITDHESTTAFNRRVRKIMISAGLVDPDESQLSDGTITEETGEDDDDLIHLVFSSFRQGAMTELGEAELTEIEIMNMSRHKSARVMRRYPKRSARLIVKSQKKRIEERAAHPPGEDILLAKRLKRTKRAL